jgi:hypothetical protein
MMQDDRAAIARKSSAAIAAALVSFSTLFAGIPVSAADPFDDDGDSSFDYDDSGSYDDGGYDDSYDEGSDDGADYSDSGSEWDYDGADLDDTGDEDDGPDDDDPSDGGMGTEAPDGGMETEAPGGGMETQAPGGGMETEAPGGGMETEAPGGGMETPAPGGGMETPAPGGGMETQAPGGGMGTETPSGGGMGTETPAPGGGMGSAEDNAPQQDVTTAEDSKAVQTYSEEVTTEEITQYSESIKQTFSKGNYSKGGKRLRSPVKRWNSKWTGYDPFYRPVFTNPYPTPMRVMYRADGKQQELVVPPMQKAVLSTRMKPGVYSFTSSTGPQNGPPTNVAVGSFSGGGYKPRPGQQPPQKPPVRPAIKNPLVQVKFAQGVSEPFRVTSLTDLGKDPSVNNLTRVLLDGEIPAWGEWGKTDKGEALFSITETQLLPGVKPPAQEPIPGYDVKLVSASKKSQSWFESNRLIIVIAGAVAGLLALVGVAIVVLKRRKGSADQTDVLHQTEPTTWATPAAEDSPSAPSAPSADDAPATDADPTTVDITKSPEPDDQNK